MYEKMCNGTRTLIRTIQKAIEKIRKRGDLNLDAIKYFIVKQPKFARFTCSITIIFLLLREKL